jgi:hypothetical protein
MSITFLSEVVIPDSVVEPFGELLSLLCGHLYDSDVDLKRSFGVIWFAVTETLLKVRGLEELIVTQGVYKENIQHLGERDFLLLLRNTLASEDWRSFLKNGIFPVP